ncbi:hypothetical protein GWK18_10475 [Kocuria sp. JC486]|uniref:Uncharacterized protein n=1 Tax=Kocuria soli TaxID=2485125 RepID=A0A3N4A861_9MICC|nr:MULTISPECIES: hypothetical protein [Kocuria]NHU86001.1 hypothetical protein [Kocuria sp. JC486]ROZ65745.1 hypothetical protein EDL96_01345 [Kocuria soli]
MTAWNLEHSQNPSRRGLNRTVLLTALGAVAGLLVGVVLTVGVVIWGMSQVVEQGGTVSLQPIIELQQAANGDVTAHSGNGVLTLAMIGLLVGAVAGALTGHFTRKS